MISSLYQYALSIVGVIALGAIIYGAILRIVSSGNPGKISEANDWIWGAIWGILLLFGGYLILQTINPGLVNLGQIESQITPPVFQQLKDQGPIKFTSTTAFYSSNPKAWYCMQIGSLNVQTRAGGPYADQATCTAACNALGLGSSGGCQYQNQ